MGEQISTPLNTIPLNNTKTDNITITDTPIKLQQFNQTPQLKLNSFIIECGYANTTNNTMTNSFTITPLTDTKPNEPNTLDILNTLIEANSDPATNTTHHDPVNETDQQEIAVITAKSII